MPFSVIAKPRGLTNIHHFEVNYLPALLRHDRVIDTASLHDFNSPDKAFVVTYLQGVSLN